jgi:hypothetical protein
MITDQAIANQSPITQSPNHPIAQSITNHPIAESITNHQSRINHQSPIANRQCMIAAS